MAVENSAPVSEGKVPAAETEVQVEAKKEPVLAPAPLPTKSPWKSVSADIPVSTISVESLESGKKKKKNKAVTPAISSSTKWVPMKASIVVSGPKRAGNGARKGNNKNATAAGSKKKKQQSQQQPVRKQSPRSVGGEREAKDELSEEKEEELQSAPDSKSMTETESEISTVGELPSITGQHAAYHRRKHNHSNQFQHSAQQQNGFQRRRYYNNYSNNDPSRQQRYMHSKSVPPSQQGRIPRFLGNGTQLINGQMQKAPYMVPVYQQYYSMQPILMAVNSIARQIEYYFSAENLAKDKYLKSKLSKDGYAPVSLIAKFYRIVNMSFGGDPSLILAALREIVFNENATVEVGYGSIENTEEARAKQEDHVILSNYFVRSKQWEALLPEEFSTVIEIEKTLQGDALDEFMISPASMQANVPGGASQETVPAGAIPENSEEDVGSSTSGAEDVKVEAN